MTDTIEQNQQQRLDHLEDVWLFGYGSLIYKVDFPFLEKRVAAIHGWERRFWQASHDHRGTPQAPGRVVTLIENPSSICTGMAYRVTPETFGHLDHREKNGYLRRFVPLKFQDPSHPRADALVYFAPPDNPAFLGDAPLEDIARQISQSVGPSGRNSEYLFKLDDALRDLGVDDDHVSTLAGRVKSLLT